MSELLNSIAKFIHEGKIKLVSIDVFDTIVFRKVAHPTDVFSMALQAYGNENEWPMGCEEFKELRVNIETQLRRQAVYGEVTLEDIYTELPFSSAVNKKLKLAELEVEKQVGFIYQPMQKFIELLRDDGIEVILISDMYLSRTQIRDCFFHNSTLLQSLPLHVSSEYKLNKSSGLLFEHLANEQKIDKSGWLHLGDNIVSDFNMPKQKNFKQNICLLNWTLKLFGV
ncbi:hypothetical protein RS130_19125 [Paraglaciecola aquimarina]|uniref:Uncharacterized protein n=1 Tax=Paraglaciecola aquimarina TaxID=1235557 RepID=A0ABU3T0C5_9ALTE|nr:hypothetical protein [Paraglaciecola aquimarina]MDU0355710.1 hypothetical protein [Paraglaciecola aquimarina]